MKRSTTVNAADSTPEAGESASLSTATATRVESLPIAKIAESTIQPAQVVSADMSKFIESVVTKGILVPVLCRPAEDGWELVFGARRLRAARAAGLAEIPSMVRTMTDRELLEVQVIENLQRADVHRSRLD